MWQQNQAFRHNEWDELSNFHVTLFSKVPIVNLRVVSFLHKDRKHEDDSYVNWEYQSTSQKVKHGLRIENKVSKNKVSSYCEALGYIYISIFVFMIEYYQNCFQLCKLYQPSTISN